MARTSLHDLLNEVAGSLQTWSSTFTAAASILFPGADQHLRVYNIAVSAPNDGADSEVQIADGSAAAFAHLYFGAGKERRIDFRPFYKRIDTALNILRPDDTNEITVTVWYKERPDNHV